MDIYQYDDFRLYLRDAFAARKKEEPSFSYRKFAQAAEIRNPGYLVDVIKGKRSLSGKVQAKVAEIFSLKPAEAEFLNLIVAYGQCKSPEEKQDIYRAIQIRRNHSSFARLNPAQARYFDDTLYLVLLHAVEAMDFRGDYEALGGFLEPSVAAGKVKKAIRELCEWGLVRQYGSGRYRAVNKFLEPPATMPGTVKRMNRDLILQAPEALTRFPADRRHISSVILDLSEKAARRVQDKLEEFRKEVFEIAKQDRDSRQVMQLTLIYFPKSKVRK
jgi:uncharacterized protein (TIGR02147 family)